MPLESYLNLTRCPHCSIDNPNLTIRTSCSTSNYLNADHREWGFYGCNRCGGIITVAVIENTSYISEMYPENVSVDESIPTKAKTFLIQAIESLHAPSASIMVAASAIDAMLKEKGYIEGSLYSRIDKSAQEHLITMEMATWAHQVRIEANNERHADYESELPTVDDAIRVVNFAKALGEFLFVLPSRVAKGLNEASRG